MEAGGMSQASSTGSSSFGGLSSSSGVSGGSGAAQRYESNVLPLIHSYGYRYPAVCSYISLVVEFMQYLAFALNPRVVGNRLVWSCIYLFQLPFWDGVLTKGAITYSSFIIFYWVISAIVVILIASFAAGLYWTRAVIRLVKNFGLGHVAAFMTSIMFIPTMQMYLSSFVCEHKAGLQTYSDSANGYVVLFKSQQCDTTLVTVTKGFSIALMVLWGLLNYVFTMTLIPVDREDASVRRRCSTTVDFYLFIYRAGLCVSGFLTTAYDQENVQAIIVCVLSFILALLHCLYLPYYARWMNIFWGVAFALIGWASLTIVITEFATESSVTVHTRMTQQGGMYAVLCCGAAVIGPLFFFLARFRYNRTTDLLFSHVLREKFVHLSQNPFAVAALQRNLELLPFPGNLPETDSVFSSLHYIAESILAEGLREEAAIREARESDARAAREGQDGGGDANKNKDGGAGAHHHQQHRKSHDSGGSGARAGEERDEGPLSTVSLLREANRRQVVSPTIGYALVPSDAEVSVRFLSDWQGLTETFPTPHMVGFGCRIFHRFFLKHPRNGMLIVAYISFLCDYAPSLPRMMLCLELIRHACEELPLSLTERYLMYYFSLHVKEALGIRDALHQEYTRRVRKEHQQALLQNSMVWRCLLEEKRSPMALYTFTHSLSLARHRCYKTYLNSIVSISDDATLMQNMGDFMAEMYFFKKAGKLCTAVAEVVSRLQRLRLEKTFQASAIAATDDATHLSAAQEEGEGEQAEVADANGNDDDAVSSTVGGGSTLNDAASSIGGGSSTHLSSSLGSSGSRLSSLCTSEGRSSQSKIRNSKKLSLQMAERARELILKSYNDLTAHMHWGVLTISGLGATTLAIIATVVVAVITLMQLKSWESLRGAMVAVSFSHAFCFTMLTQAVLTGRLLPTDATAGLSVTATQYLQSNITYLKAIIDATEAAHSELFYGTGRSDDGTFQRSLTDLSMFFRIYTTQTEYQLAQVSFLTHVTMAIAAAREVVTLLETTPTWSAFESSVALSALSSNMMNTLNVAFQQVEQSTLSARSEAGNNTIVLSIVACAIALILCCLGAFLMLWNYRRATTIIVKELMQFYLIPRDSIERLAGEAQHQLEKFSTLMLTATNRTAGANKTGVADFEGVEDGGAMGGPSSAMPHPASRTAAGAGAGRGGSAAAAAYDPDEEVRQPITAEAMARSFGKGVPTADNGTGAGGALSSGDGGAGGGGRGYGGIGGRGQAPSVRLLSHLLAHNVGSVAVRPNSAGAGSQASGFSRVSGSQRRPGTSETGSRRGHGSSSGGAGDDDMYAALDQSVQEEGDDEYEATPADSGDGDGDDAEANTTDGGDSDDSSADDNLKLLNMFDYEAAVRGDLIDNVFRDDELGSSSGDDRAPGSDDSEDGNGKDKDQETSMVARAAAANQPNGPNAHDLKKKKSRRQRQEERLRRLGEARQKVKNIGFVAANYELSKRILEDGGGTQNGSTSRAAASSLAVATAEEEAARVRRMAPPVVLAAICLLVGFIFSIMSIFAYSNITGDITSGKEVIACIHNIGNASINTHVYVSRYVIGAKYGDYVRASNAFLATQQIITQCRPQLNSTAFFPDQDTLSTTELIGIALVAQNEIQAAGAPADAQLAFPLIASLSYSPPPKSVENVARVQPYLTVEELDDWVPYTTPATDFALPAAQRQELAINTVLGPYGLAVLEGTVTGFETLADDIISLVDGVMAEKLQDYRIKQIVSIACCSVALLFGIVFTYIAAASSAAASSTEETEGPAAHKKQVGSSTSTSNYVTLILSIVFIIFAAVGIGLASWNIVAVTNLVDGFYEWLDDARGLMQVQWQWARVDAFTSSYPFIDYETSVNRIYKMTSPEFFRQTDTALLPPPSTLNRIVHTKEYYAMAEAKSQYLHYVWLIMVCTIWGRDRTSLFASFPEISYVRWDMLNDSQDPILKAYKTFYPQDTYLTTYQNDVTAATPAQTLSTAQGFMQSTMMQELSLIAVGSQSAVTSTLYAQFSSSVDNLQSTSTRAGWVQFAFICVAFGVLLMLIVALATLLIRTFSRTVEEQIIFQTAFSQRSKRVFYGFAVVFILLAIICVLCIIFSLENDVMMAIVMGVVKVRYSPSVLMATVIGMAVATRYTDYLGMRETLRQSLDEVPSTYQQAYYSSKAAADTRSQQNVYLFGSETFDAAAVANAFSSSIWRPLSCMDPTSKSSDGNEQPMRVQKDMFGDLIRSIAELPITAAVQRAGLFNYLEDAASRLGTLQYYTYNAQSNSLAYIVDSQNAFFDVILVLSIITLLIVVLMYIFCIRRIEVEVRQHSVGTKAMLLGIPPDILNTLPEITEFYDPESGSSGDQIKKRMQQSERLLQNILPLGISRRLKNGERVIADAHPRVTVVFAALVGMDEYGHKLNGTQLVLFMNRLVVAFDHIVDLLDLEKIKLVGDIYFFCGGLTRKTEHDHALRCMEAALFFFQALEDHNSRHGTPHIKLKIGINTGPVVAGVIGNKKVAYDLWGDCVNTASRMYSTGEPGRVQVSQSTFERISKYYLFEDRQVQAKGKGMLPTHLFLDRVKNTPYTEINWRIST